jgi:endonuclease/exonuclease/phosphatase family metal-dependent hydrolase
VDFTPAHSRLTGAEYHACVNGEQYGVAMIYHGDGRAIHRGWYVNQGRGIEIRTWTCATVIKGRLTGCTTHLSINAEIAMRQCQELMTILAASWMTPQVIISGDFNLATAPAQDCAAPGLLRHSDDGAQQVYYSLTLDRVQGRHEPMRWTDHPLLYERFRS